MSSLVCFTDGSAIKNGSPNARASYSVVWPEHPHMNVAVSIPPPCTNNRGEFSGAIRALQQADELDPLKEHKLVIYTDSMLLVNSLTKWISKWIKNGWVKSDGSEVLNKDLLKLLVDGMEKRKVDFVHVKAHTKAMTFEAINNRLADRLAKDCLVNST